VVVEVVSLALDLVGVVRDEVAFAFLGIALDPVAVGVVESFTFADLITY
jgi:hypothetical protein